MNWHPDLPVHVADAAGTAWLVRRAWPDALAGDYILEVSPLGIGLPAAAGVRAAHLRQGIFDPVEQDPKLPSLLREAAKGEVVVHRAHQRAVVCAGNRYIKVFRRGRALKAAERHNLATLPLAGGYFDTPRILDLEPDVLALSRLPGRSYYELGQDQITVTDASFAAKWAEWSQAWTTTVTVAGSAAFGSVLDCLPPHPAEAEIVNLRRWLDSVLTHSEGIPEAAAARAAMKRQAEAIISGLLDAPPDPLGWAHGDLHDKQILGDGSISPPGLLDFDESCRAEAALDLANLDVHLELRRFQKLLTARRYAIAHREILAAAAELRVSPERFAAYSASTRLRLACLYSFRPSWGAQACRYLSQAPQCDAEDADDALSDEPPKAESSTKEWSLT